MSGVRETSTFEEEIYQLEITDPIMGGPDGISNVQATQLASRTRFLKDIFEKEHTAAGAHNPLELTKSLLNSLTDAEFAPNAAIAESKVAMQFVGNLRPGGLETYKSTKEIAEDISRITRMNSLGDLILNEATLESMADAFVQCYGSSGSIVAGEEARDDMIAVSPTEDFFGGIFASVVPCPKSMNNQLYIGDFMRWLIRGYVIHPTAGVTVTFPAPRVLSDILAVGPNFKIAPRIDLLYVTVTIEDLTVKDIFYDNGDTAGTPQSWQGLSELQQRLIATDISNNIFTGSDYHIHQIQYTLKTAPDSATLKSIGYSSVGQDSALFYKDAELAIELLRVERRNGGAYHPTINPNGAGLFFTETVANLHSWWEAKAVALVSGGAAPKYSIRVANSSIETAHNYIKFGGNRVDEFYVGWTVRITGSTDNDGDYPIAQTTYSESADETEVSLLSTLPSNTSDGFAASVEQFQITQCFNQLGEGFNAHNSGLVNSEACGIVNENEAWSTHSNLLFADFIDMDSITDLRIHLRTFERGVLAPNPTVPLPEITITDVEQAEGATFSFSVDNPSADYKYTAKVEWADGKDAGPVIASGTSFTWVSPEVLADTKAYIKIKALSLITEGSSSAWSSDEVTVTNNPVEEPILEFSPAGAGYPNDEVVISVKNYSALNNYVFSVRTRMYQTFATVTEIATGVYGFTIDSSAFPQQVMVISYAALKTDSSIKTPSRITYFNIKAALPIAEDAIVFDLLDFSGGAGSRNQSFVAATDIETQDSGEGDWLTAQMELLCKASNLYVKDVSTASTIVLLSPNDTMDISNVYTDKGNSEVTNIRSDGDVSIALESTSDFTAVIRTLGAGTPTFKGIGTLVYAFVNKKIYKTSLTATGELLYSQWQECGTIAFSTSGKYILEIVHDYIYLFGPDVYRATINADYTISNFVKQTGQVPAYRPGCVSATIEGKVFLFGGMNGAYPTDEIQYASIADDGTLGAWNGSSYVLPTALHSASAVLSENQLALFAYTTQSGVSTNVITFDIYGSLSVSPETLTDVLPAPSTGHNYSNSSVFTTDEGTYVLAKYSDGTGLVAVANLNDDGEFFAGSKFKEVGGVGRLEVGSHGACISAGEYLYWYGPGGADCSRIQLRDAVRLSPTNDPTPFTRKMYYYVCSLATTLSGAPSIVMADTAMFIEANPVGAIKQLRLFPSTSTTVVTGMLDAPGLIANGDQVLRNGKKETVLSTQILSVGAEYQYRLTLNEGPVAKTVYCLKGLTEFPMADVTWEYVPVDMLFKGITPEITFTESDVRSLRGVVSLEEGTFIERLTMHVTKEA